MILTVVIFFCIQYDIVHPYKHEKEMTKQVWPEKCFGQERVLNDCNWCVCDRRTSKFVCKARVCSEVDMFGHFNDAIREYEVGMEGHGSWRTTDTSCTPHTQYQREGLLCVCDEDGNWPNPVCRDLFRVLHKVEVTGRHSPSALHECTPRKLYLYGCNVCFCPSEGRIDPSSCTRHNCSDNDPILEPSSNVTAVEDKYNVTEIYAQCELERKYVVGCRKCICLKNNRLLCDNCERESLRSASGNYCEKFGQDRAFNIDCNMCVCDERNTMYCTTRRCLNNVAKPIVELSKAVDLTLRAVEPPIDSDNCIVGTKFYRGCNICFCSETSDNKKILSCSMKFCYGKNNMPNLPLPQMIRSDCVENTVYEESCAVCRCDAVDGVKRESCVVDSDLSECGRGAFALRENRSVELESLHGYCEPAHYYKKDCNTCKCLSDGKPKDVHCRTKAFPKDYHNDRQCAARIQALASRDLYQVVACTDRICARAPRPPASPPLVVAMVPVRQSGARCRRDHMYKVDCNFCFCLSTGNFLCTTAQCDRDGNVREDY